MTDLLHRIWENKIFRTALLFVLSLAALVSVSQGVRNAAVFSQDFQWDAVKAFSMKIDPYEESLHPTDAGTQGRLADYYNYYLSIDAPQKMEANQFPSLLMFLLPYTLLTPNVARITWLIANLLFTAGIILLLRQTFLSRLGSFEYAVLMLIMLAGTPYRNQLGVGQHTLFSFFFFLLAVWLMEDKWGSIPGTLCLTISYFKYTLTAPLALYFIYKRKWKEVIVSILIHVALTFVSAAWLGKSFLDMIIEPIQVSKKLLSEGGLDIGAIFHGSPISLVIAGIIAIALLVLMLKTPQGNESLVISVVLLWSLIMFYHRTYDFFPIVIVAAFFYEHADTTYLKAGYAVVLFSVFFVLRIFSEALPARIVVGVLYYIFAIAMGVLLVKKAFPKKLPTVTG